MCNAYVCTQFAGSVSNAVTQRNSNTANGREIEHNDHGYGGVIDRALCATQKIPPLSLPLPSLVVPPSELVHLSLLKIANLPP